MHGVSICKTKKRERGEDSARRERRETPNAYNLAKNAHQTCIRRASDVHQTRIRRASDVHPTHKGRLTIATVEVDNGGTSSMKNGVAGGDCLNTLVGNSLQLVDFLRCHEVLHEHPLAVCAREAAISIVVGRQRVLRGAGHLGEIDKLVGISNASDCKEEEDGKRPQRSQMMRGAFIHFRSGCFSA